MPGVSASTEALAAALWPLHRAGRSQPASARARGAVRSARHAERAHGTLRELGARVLKAVSAALPNGGEIDEILDLADAFLCSRHVVSLDPAGLRTVTIRLHDGAVVARSGRGSLDHTGDARTEARSSIPR